MTVLVRKDENDVWVRWDGDVATQKINTKANVIYADGRQEEIDVPPYPTTVIVNGNSMKNFYDQGIWSLEEIEAVSGRLANDFVVPDGKQIVGQESFVEDGDEINQVYEVEDIPEPPAPPTPTEKFDAWLASIGLTRNEFLAQLT